MDNRLVTHSLMQKWNLWYNFWKKKNILIRKNKEDFYVFKPNSKNEYTANITYNKMNKALNPNKYWLALDNNFNFNEDLEIIINLTIEEIHGI